MLGYDRRVNRAAIWLSAAVALAAACGSESARDGGDVRPCGTGTGRVQLGEGGSTLIPLPPEGGALEIVRGAQGGIHVLVGFRVWDMELDMTVRYELTDPETGERIGSPTDRALRPSLFTLEGADRVRNPDLVILDNETPRVEDFVGRVAILTLDAVSESSHACDTRRVTLIDDDM